MKDHKIIPEKMYTSMEAEPQPMYPHIGIPSEVFEGHKCELGEKYKVTMIIDIDSMDKFQYGCKLLKSECEDEK